MAAEQEGRKEIALSLLKNEDSIKDQVPILLTMKQYEAALSIAVVNCEADIVYGIISEMKAAGNSMVEILTACLKVEGATSYLVSYAQQRRMVNPQDETLPAIYDFVRKSDQRNPQAAEMVRRLQHVGIPDIEEYDQMADTLHVSTVKEAQSRLAAIMRTPKHLYPRIKAFAEQQLIFLDAKAAHVGMMKKKGVNPGDAFIRSAGPFQALMALHEKKEAATADTMVKKLKIDPRQYQLVRFRAAAKSAEWTVFNDIFKREKSKIPPIYLAKTCLEFDNKEVARDYIKLIPNIDERVSMLLEIEYAPHTKHVVVCSRTRSRWLYPPRDRISSTTSRQNPRSISSRSFRRPSATWEAISNPSSTFVTPISIRWSLASLFDLFKPMLCGGAVQSELMRYNVQWADNNKAALLAK